MCSVVAFMTFNITNSHTITPSLTSTPTSRQNQNPYSYHAFDWCTHFFLSFFACHHFFYTIYKSFISGYVLKNIFFWFWERVIGSWILILTLVFHMPYDLSCGLYCTFSAYFTLVKPFFNDHFPKIPQSLRPHVMFLLPIWLLIEPSQAVF